VQIIRAPPFCVTWSAPPVAYNGGGGPPGRDMRENNHLVGTNAPRKRRSCGFLPDKNHEARVVSPKLRLERNYDGMMATWDVRGHLTTEIVLPGAWTGDQPAPAKLTNSKIVAWEPGTSGSRQGLTAASTTHDPIARGIPAIRHGKEAIIWSGGQIERELVHPQVSSGPTSWRPGPFRLCNSVFNKSDHRCDKLILGRRL